jgi:hypothetical protein
MPQDHYINNKDFLIALIGYKKKVSEARKKKKPTPQLNEYIGHCFLKIAENLSRKPNFASYTFKEDMISDAVENCLRCVDNFNPEKSKNPFSYFTQIIYFAFLRKISSEKKQLYTRYKATEQLGLLQDVKQGDLEGIGQDDHQFKVYENINDFIVAFEKSKKQKMIKSKRPKKTMSRGILRFMGDR